MLSLSTDAMGAFAAQCLLAAFLCCLIDKGLTSAAFIARNRVRKSVELLIFGGEFLKYCVDLIIGPHVRQ